MLVPMLLPANRVVGENGIFECFGHIGLAWIWLDTVTAAAGCRGDFYDGTRQVACYFVIYELREVAAQLDLLAAVDTTTLQMSPG